MGLADRLNRAARRVPTVPLYFMGMLPAGWWYWQALTGRIGADPVAALEHQYGLLALQLLVAGLCVTPLRDLTGVNLLRFRRLVGVMAFFYACCHVAVWLWFDRQLDPARIIADLTRRPYIIVGFSAFVLLIPLAVTSTNRALRRLGPLRWRRLHRLVYPAAALAAAHFIWLVKAWPPEPLAYGLAVVLLLSYRALRGRVRLLRPGPGAARSRSA